MAVFGHSGSQAPQLMHSLVITVAIAGGIPWRPGAFKRAWSLEGAGDRRAHMITSRTVLLLIPGRLLAVRAVRAEAHPDLVPAQRARETAREHLNAGGRVPGG